MLVQPLWGRCQSIRASSVGCDHGLVEVPRAVDLYVVLRLSAPGACHDRDAGTPYLHAEVSGAWIIVPATGPVPTVVWAVAAANDELAIAEA